MVFIERDQIFVGMTMLTVEQRANTRHTARRLASFNDVAVLSAHRRLLTKQPLRHKPVNKSHSPGELLNALTLERCKTDCGGKDDVTINVLMDEK